MNVDIKILILMDGMNRFHIGLVSFVFLSMNVLLGTFNSLLLRWISFT